MTGAIRQTTTTTPRATIIQIEGAGWRKKPKHESRNCRHGRPKICEKFLIRRDDEEAVNETDRYQDTDLCAKQQCDPCVWPIRTQFRRDEMESLLHETSSLCACHVLAYGLA